MPSILNGTEEISAQEFKDAIFLHHTRTPGNLPSLCDGCGAKFDVRHALGCKVWAVSLSCGITRSTNKM
jgi:hypothetical protein